MLGNNKIDVRPTIFIPAYMKTTFEANGVSIDDLVNSSAIGSEGGWGNEQNKAIRELVGNLYAGISKYDLLAFYSLNKQIWRDLFGSKYKASYFSDMLDYIEDKLQRDKIDTYGSTVLEYHNKVLNVLTSNDSINMSDEDNNKPYELTRVENGYIVILHTNFTDLLFDKVNGLKGEFIADLVDFIFRSNTGLVNPNTNNVIRSYVNTLVSA